MTDGDMINWVIILQQATNDCRSRTEEAYDECLRAIPSIGGLVPKVTDPVTNVVTNALDGAKKTVGKWFGGRKRRSSPSDIQHLCKPIKLGSASCDLIQSQALCAPLSTITNINPLDQLHTLLNTVLDLFTFSVKPKQNITAEAKSTVGNITAEFENIRDEFESKLDALRMILKYCQIYLFLPILFLPFILAYFTIRSYRKVASKGKPLLTQKFFKAEARKETKHISHQVVFLLMHFLLTGAILSFDFLLHWTQTVAKTHGTANFTAVGAVRVSLDVDTGPVLQPVVDHFINSIGSINREYDITLSADECLPDPQQPVSVQTVVLIAATYAFMVFTFVLQLFVGKLKKNVLLASHPHPPSC
jgi:hypothetical protein